jgi:hypothetical protein
VQVGVGIALAGKSGELGIVGCALLEIGEGRQLLEQRGSHERKVFSRNVVLGRFAKASLVELLGKIVAEKQDAVMLECCGVGREIFGVS